MSQEENSNTFSFRAECRYDVNVFKHNVRALDKSFHVVTITPDENAMPDVDCEITSTATLEELRKVLAGQLDGHVILETVRQCPLVDNTLEKA